MTPQPISTAPTDGTIIQAWHEGYKVWFAVKMVYADKTAMNNDQAWQCVITGAIYPPNSLRFWMPAPEAPPA